LYWRKILTLKDYYIMNNNVKGMIWTASAVVVGIIVATMVQKKLMAKKTATASSDEE
jgi:hypothetical protein